MMRKMKMSEKIKKYKLSINKDIPEIIIAKKK